MLSAARSPDIVSRWEGNPIITPDDLAIRCTSICNAGAVKVADEYILLLTVQSLEGLFFILPARSLDGYHFTVEDRPLMTPSTEPLFARYEEMGILDARTSPLEGAFYIAYDALGPHGYRVGLASTSDFHTVRRISFITEPDTKGGGLFPRKIRGRYARLERPWEGRSIWVSYSDDLEYWGGSEVVMTPRGGFWDCSRIGAAVPPLEIPEGFLIIYYGVKETSSGPLFRLGAAILDAENPAQVIGRTNVPILSPREHYERVGDVNNLVFACGAIIESDGEVKIYYGAANACICVGTTRLAGIVEACQASVKDF